MNKKFIISLLSALALVLPGCGGQKMGTYPDADKYVAGSKEYENVEVNKIAIDWISGSLTLIEDESATGVTISEVTTLTEENALVHTYLHDGILNVKYFASGYWIDKFNYQKALTITYNPGLDELEVDMTSGNLTATTINSKKVNFDFTSGTINVENIVSDDISVDLTSGRATLTKVNAKNFNGRLTSGSIKTNFETVEKASFNLTSGNIDITLPTSGGSVNVNKTSGSVIANRECTISENIYKFGSGTSDIKVSMTSGIVTIN